MAPQTDTIAAIDLGSNSFHAIVARAVQDQLHVLDRLRERVALADGLDARKHLTSDAQERALACIERIGERVRGMPAGSVRAVGTSTLRMARNARAFIARAEEALGHPIEVISGAEEARLIYLGVAHDVSDDARRRLVIDIGGGSTECILGERFEALKTDSLHMGCVIHSQKYFPGGALGRESMERALIAARLEVQSMERHYRALGWDECVGASGTIMSVDAILRENQWSERGITAKGLRKLRKAIVALEHADQLVSIPGVQAERAPVLAGGVAILSALFDGLEIETMNLSQGALREGVLYDLMGRIRHEDLRDQTIKRFSERYHVDLVQSGRVQRTALALLAQSEEWNIPAESGKQLLTWAARLHEIGLSLSHNGYHKHGAYIVDHSDMPGFSNTDQAMLAALIEGHRRKLVLERFEALPSSMHKLALRLCLLLRLAVLLNRSRGQQPVPKLALKPKKNGYELEFPDGWLAGNPLTSADLDQEQSRLEPAGFTLSVR